MNSIPLGSLAFSPTKFRDFFSKKRVALVSGVAPSVRATCPTVFLQREHLTMCGIAGAWSPTPTHSSDYLQTTGALMASALAHRGPDAQGIWIDSKLGLVLAHRRLSIVDLSTAGHQPMCSESGRYVIVFNGEIYNHLELRKD